MEIHIDDVVFCEVKKVEGTTVFLEIEGVGEGSMTLSEVAAGRIRNLREYVSPGKKIVCKVLKITGDHIELSLRRVTAKERQDVLDRYKKERALMSILKLSGENAQKIIEEIEKEYDISSFFDEMRVNPKILENYLPKEKVQKVIDAVAEKVGGKKVVGSTVYLKSFADEGILQIQEVLNVSNVEIRYLGSGKFSVHVSGNDFKEANTRLHSILAEMEKSAKQKKLHFEIVKK